MKKLTFLLAVFAAGLLTTSCSSDNEAAAVDNSGLFNANGEAFLTVSINQPTTGMRAATFEGEASDDEATVGSAILALFAGPSEDDATFQAAYSLTSLTEGAAVANNIQKTYTVTVKNNDVIRSNFLYAFVIANPGSVFSVDGIKLKVKDAKASTYTTYAAATPTKFSDFKKKEIDDYGTGTAMLMTNVPLANKAGGTNNPSSATVTTLTKIDETYLKPTEEASKGAPVTIYVERVAAKVGVGLATGTWTKDAAGLVTTTVKGGIKWVVDNQEPTTFLVRNFSTTYFGYQSSVTAADDYRFISDTKEKAGEDIYRLFWAEDPHYAYVSGDESKKQQSLDPTNLFTTVTDPNKIDVATGSTAYAFENTMNEWGMTHDKTTRVLVKVPFSTTAFFAMNGEDKILTKAAAETATLTYIKSMATVKTYIAGGKDESKLSVTLTGNDDGTVTLKGQYNGADDTDLDTAIGDLATTLKLKYYPTGNAYYTILIHHFDKDNETPLASTSSGNTYATIYGTTPSAQDYLGRFGVVRNNWYQITIDGISHLGEPIIPDPSDDTTPDDDHDKYISYTIYVTKWAKHSESVTL